MSTQWHQINRVTQPKLHFHKQVSAVIVAGTGLIIVPFNVNSLGQVVVGSLYVYVKEKGPSINVDKSTCKGSDKSKVASIG